MMIYPLTPRLRGEQRRVFLTLKDEPFSTRATLPEPDKAIHPHSYTSRCEQGRTSCCLQRHEPVGSPKSWLTSQQSEPASKPHCATLIWYLCEGAFEAATL